METLILARHGESDLSACGIVNGHIAACWVRDAVEAQRRAVA